MKTLLILRHAKSSWKHEDIPDHDRPLKKRGKRDAPKMGHLILEQNLTPQLILSSTAKRARKTAKRVAKACEYEGERRLEPAFYNAGPTAYIKRLRRLNDRYQRVMVVGHNPGLELLLEVLTGEVRRLPTAALVVVELPIPRWSELREHVGGTLAHLWVPRDLKNGY